MSRILIAEDEPLMRERLLAQLQVAWPDGEVVAVAKDGLQALEQWRQLRPQVAFLDIRMPGKSGLEVAAEIGDQAHVVFVTAYDEYAIPAFEQGAVDYLVKPVEPERLAVAVQRIQKRIGAAPPDWSAVVAGLLNRGQPASKLKWIRASLGNQTRVIDVADVLFFQSDAKYTRIVLRDSEALVRTPVKELVEGLDPESFWQVHRGTIVNVAAIDRAVREGPEKLVLHLKGCAEKLGVSRQYFHLFRQG